MMPDVGVVGYVEMMHRYEEKGLVYYRCQEVQTITPKKDLKMCCRVMGIDVLTVAVDVQGCQLSLEHQQYCHHSCPPLASQQTRLQTIGKILVVPGSWSGRKEWWWL